MKSLEDPDAEIPGLEEPALSLLGEMALEYARAGLDVFPLGANKQPLTAHGMKEATRDEVQIRLWWTERPDALIGCRVPEDVVVIDVDPKSNGMATWKALKDTYGSLPFTRAHRSGRNDGGGHLWFERPEGKLSAKSLNDWAREHGTGQQAGEHSWNAGIDLLHHGHRYTILPPSPHPATGKPYRWIDGRGADVAPAAMPEWLVKLVTIEPVEKVERVHTDSSTDSPADWYSEHTDWCSLLMPEGWELVSGDGDADGSTWRHPTATSAQSATIRNHCLFVYSPNTDFEVTEDGDPHGYTPFAALAVLRHEDDMKAAARAAAKLRDEAMAANPIADFPSNQNETTVDKTDAQTPDDDNSDTEAVAPDGYRLTDAGNAQRFIKLAGGKVRYVHQWGRWIVYRQGRWMVDSNDALVTETAKRVPRALWTMVTKSGGEERSRIYKAAVRAESAASLAAMVRLARGISGVIIDHEELDAKPEILNVANGTIDLLTGQFRRHDPADLCTKQCPVAFDPAATAPLWDECLRRWQPDQDVRLYLQRETGAGTTGYPTETVSVHFGNGSNGKSKFFGAIQRVLGPYAVVPHKSLLVAAKHEQHATVIASLFRARLAVASETGMTDRLNEEQIKNITGGDVLGARRMREDEWHFLPSHTLVLFSNHRPAVQGEDEGIWRRLRLVPWGVTIPEAERDERLADKLASEAPGILRWLVEGARLYLANGLNPPASVRAATDSYRAGEDTAAQFLADTVTFSPGGEVKSTDLQVAHTAWCAEAGIKAVEHWPKVTAKLKRHGARPRRKHEGRFWSGIELLEAFLQVSGLRDGRDAPSGSPHEKQESSGELEPPSRPSRTHPTSHGNPEIRAI